MTFEVIKVLFAMAFGACVGSLSNVLVYRIPLGLDFVSPQSRCTNCDTKLTWRENIPIFGWLFLRGRCRFCKSPVSAEYPIVEAFMAALWGLTFIVCYTDRSTWLGNLVMPLRPEWAYGGFEQTWPIYVCIVMLWACLTCATLVDWRTFTIPPLFTNVPVILAVIAYPLWALYISRQPGGSLQMTSPGHSWSIATFGDDSWPWLGAALGGVLGLIIANILLRYKVLRRSFEDYAAWEKDWLSKLEQEGKDPNNPENWIAYPHARREMFRELLFVGFPLAFAIAGFAIAHKLAGPWVFNPSTLRMESTLDTVPLVWQVLTGVLLGYLIGGGIVWLFRILGSLGFGKEALGLGDVHLMAAVGAVLGWIDPVIAFFGGAIVGMIIFLVQLFRGKEGGRVMPFGPPLCIAVVLLFFAKPAFEALASWAMKSPIDLP